MKSKISFLCNISFMLCCIVLVICTGTSLAGITGKIAGKVTASETATPLPGVNVMIKGTTLGAVSDLSGDYFILNVPPGSYTLVASIIGYEVVNKTEVVVSIDRTIKVNFSMKQTAIQGEEVTVTAERDIVPMDVSASQTTVQTEQILAVPLVSNVAQYLQLMSGVEGDLIRGGGADQTGALVDGLMMVNNRTNKPLLMTNLSAMRELSVTKGGFNAEYGNVRSGLINIVTKEGAQREYHGSIDFRYSPAHLKHSGQSVYDPMNYSLRPYLDSKVAFVGTATGWDAETAKQYPTFVGWDKISADLLADSDPTNDRTPEQCRDLFLWQHFAKGSSALGQKEGKDGKSPDWNTDASFSGPVPVIGKYLGNLTFFASHRTNWESYAIPTSQDYFKENNTTLKMTSRMSPAMKLSFEGAIASIHSLNQQGEAPQDDNYLSSDNYSWGGQYGLRDPYGGFDVYRKLAGVTLDHVLSPRTFYNVRISFVNVNNVSVGLEKNPRDTTTVKYFGATPVDKRGWQTNLGARSQNTADGLNIPGPDYGAAYDSSKVSTLNARFDLTTQYDKYNQIKLGLEFNYDVLKTKFGQFDARVLPAGRYGQLDDHSPIRIGAYVQDKLEFEGMIANIGLRMDYSDPNTEWYDLDPYSKYFKRQYRDTFTEVAPKKAVKGHFKLSPRLGISHPISKNAKLYFNYGHFYSMTFAKDMYRIGLTEVGQGVTFIGNPSANLPRTIAYEIGLDYDIANMLLFHVAGFYKDVSGQTFYEHVYYLDRTSFNAGIQYTNFDGSVDYSTVGNNNYADIRGFEISLDKRFGEWVTGWINYNYIVTTQGYIGRQHYFQDVRLQQREGLMNPYQEKPVAQPFIRANARILTPIGFGPALGGFKPLEDIEANFLFTWKSGDYMTWDPLETGLLKSNVHWRNRVNLDARFGKGMRFGKFKALIFVDVQNLLNIKYLSSLAFASAQDRLDYFKSLHLPMYSGEEYKSQGMTPGHDKPGDVKSSDKPYIDMPNREYLWYLNPRSIFLGIKFEF